jgi:tetratricopeptide (TPR) repeat protein
LPASPPGQPASEAHAQLACGRAASLLATGPLSAARREIARCSQGDRPFLRGLVLLNGATADALAGDRAQAATQLERAESTMPSGQPDSWIHLIDVASLASRLGETEKSERIYSQLLPQLQPTGYTLLIGQATIGLAENAAARGDWARSRIHAADARKLIADDVWVVSNRLDLLAIADARQRGDRHAVISLASRLHERARQLGDAAVETDLHRMLQPGAFENDCSAAEREALVARTGMRGIDLDWLSPAGEAARNALP